MLKFLKRKKEVEYASENGQVGGLVGLENTHPGGLTLPQQAAIIKAGDMRTNEGILLVRLQEECAELSQVISKILRFGYDNTYEDGTTNEQALIREAADVLVSIDNLQIPHDLLEIFKERKRKRLEQWSSIERKISV